MHAHGNALNRGAPERTHGSRKLILTVGLGVLACNPPAPPGKVDDAAVVEESRLAFKAGAHLDAVVGRPTHVELVASDKAHIVALWLEGKYLDASLESDTVALKGGTGDIVLRPPSEQAEFDLAARSDDGRIVRMKVNASPSGTATLNVSANYLGVRAKPEIAVLVYPNITCAEVTAKSQTQYATHAASTSVTLTDIPAGRPLAIVSRILGYAEGCINRRSLLPDTAADVSVTVRDTALNLATQLDATLAIDFTTDSAKAWSDAQLVAIGEMTDTFHPEAAMSSTWLLALMDANSAAHQGEFRSRRMTGKWDAVTSSWLVKRGANIRNSLKSTLLAARAGVSGPFFMRIDDAHDSTAQVTISSLGLIPAIVLDPTKVVLLDTPTRFAWTADPSDTLTLKGEIVLAMHTLLAWAGDERARIDGETNVATAVATTDVDCTGLSAALAAADATGLCDAKCLSTMCKTAITSAWKQASVTAQSQMMHLSVSAVASAVVGENAQPTAFNGTWVGVVSAPDGAYPQFTIGGSAKGKSP